MTEYEKQKVVETVKGMTDEELSVAVSVIPSKPMFVELFNRSLNNERKIDRLKELIASYEEH